MDRRQRKTRHAIFRAFTDLLAQQDYDRITVGQILEKADISRATFYAHFETKDYLLKALCEELFAHVFEAESGNDPHGRIFDCDAPDSVFLHLFSHLQKNDNNILELLSSRNNDLFLRYFKTNLTQLVERQISLFQDRKAPELPEGFWVDHIASTFVETVRWWVENDRSLPPETLTRYFLLAV